MKNNIQIFKNEEFGDVRTATVNNEPMFCLADVCRALELKNPPMVKNRLNKKGINSIDTLTKGGNQKLLYINESNLYKTIFQSRKESAERFTDWVTSEVLPSIRKHGIYATDNVIDNILNNPDFGIQLLTELKEERAEKERLALENKEMKPKVEYHDNVLNKSDLITTTVIAKDLGLSSAAKLNQVMYANRIIYKGPFGSWCPFAEYEWLIKEGYADYKSYAKENAKLCLKWTEKGRKWIIDNYNEWVRNLLKD